MENEITNLIADLQSKKATEGYQALKELLKTSENSNIVYPYMESFLEMIKNDNSYIRTRGLLLLIANARWDTDDIIDKNIDEILSHIVDAKSITSRQFIQTLPVLAQNKPGLCQNILNALHGADTFKYPDSMRPLVEKDIRAAISAIERRK